jgi:riboflavin-specific deaminase-like protein
MSPPAPKSRARPFVLINMAMTADGKIANANRHVSSFSSARDQEHLYELRATADAVMAGARTLDLNVIHLGPGGERFRRERIRRGLQPDHVRVVASGSGSIDPRASIFKKRFSPIVLLVTERARPARLRTLRALADEVLVCGEVELDFALAFRELSRRWGVRRLLCEGGGELNDALFRARLVDELHLTLCPKIFGGREAPTIVDGLGFPRLAGAMPMRQVSSRQVGDELFLVYRVGRGRGAQPRRRSSSTR